MKLETWTCSRLRWPVVNEVQLPADYGNRFTFHSRHSCFFPPDEIKICLRFLNIVYLTKLHIYNVTIFPTIELWNLSLCFLRPCLSTYCVSHIGHLTMALLSPSWTFEKCRLKCRLSENFLSQDGHWTRCEPSPCADFLWYFKGVTSVKALGQRSHWYFLTLKWTPLVCLSLSAVVLNNFEHSGQGTSLMSTHASLCRSSPAIWEKDLLHFEQV